MYFSVLTILLAAAAPSLAEDVREEKQAEYIRLSQELEKLAQRNAWAGVERTYGKCVATGAPLTFQDHLFGAHAARALGDVTSARERLLAANELEENREVVDWLWEIDSSYGQVSLRGDPGVTLEAVEMPFDPMQSLSITFAGERVVETAEYDGYLPQGRYRFGSHEITVKPRVSAVRIDIRTDEGMKELEKRKKARKE